MIRYGLSILFLLSFLPGVAQAEENAFLERTAHGEVVMVRSFGERSIPETRLRVAYQELSVRITEGPHAGRVVTVENTTAVAFEAGDQLWVHYITSEDGTEFWSAGEPDRVKVLVVLGILFVVLTLFIGGVQGARSLVSLMVSFVVIIVGLVPALALGAPPVLTCALFAASMLVLSMYITHGVNRPTTVALFGSIVALVFAIIVAETAVTFAKLSGFTSDEATYLNFANGGSLDLSALLLGSILIGIVGVLNDISVSQVHTVAEIHSANRGLTRMQVFGRAVKVGREHLGAVVNTLPLAYAGAALPLLILFSASESPFLYILNREVFSAEVIRIFSGGIALTLSGALATALAIPFLVQRKVIQSTINQDK